MKLDRPTISWCLEEMLHSLWYNRPRGKVAAIKPFTKYVQFTTFPSKKKKKWSCSRLSFPCSYILDLNTIREGHHIYNINCENVESFKHFNGKSKMPIGDSLHKFESNHLVFRDRNLFRVFCSPIWSGKSNVKLQF